MSGSGDPGSGNSGFWDPASEPPRSDDTNPFDPEPARPYQPPGPSYEPPSYDAGSGGNGQPPQTVWSPVESGPRPAFPPHGHGPGPDWQQTADLSRRTPVEPTLMIPPVLPVNAVPPVQAAQQVQPGAPARGHRSGRRRGITITAIVLAVLILLVAADRVTAYVADRRTATEIVNTYGLSQAPTVHFDGFPFLTQLATSHYRQITVSAKDVPIKQQSGGFTVAELHGTLTGVQLSNSEVRIASLQGDALVGYSAASELMGRQISYAGQDASGGRIKIKLTGTLVVTAGLGFDAASKKFQVRDLRLDAAGQSVSVDVLAPLINQLMQPVSELPDGVEVNRVDVTPDGLRVYGAGSNLVLPR